MKLLTLSVLMFSNICSFAEKPHDSGADKRLILEVIWGTPDNPKCKLNGEVSPDGLFTLKSKDGRYAAGGKLGTPNDKGYPIAITLFTWRSESSHELLSVAPVIKLGLSHEWVTVVSVARFYSITLTKPAGLDAGGPKTETEQDITNQPATASESVPEGNEKTKPEPEAGSQ